MKIGIQVSSLKPLLLTEAQVAEVFSRMRALGCRTVQLQWIDPSVSLDAIARALTDNNIESVSVQDFYEIIKNDFDYYANLNAVTGGKWLCVSRIPDRLKSRSGLDAYISELRSMQEKLDVLGQTLCFHPVSTDFTAVPGMNAVEYLLEHMPELAICLDLYHLSRNCADMPAFLRRYAGRVCMVHFKDAKDGKLVPAGQGDTDWRGVVAACLESGVPYAFVEQETWNRDPYDCLKEAMDWVGRQMKGYCSSVYYGYIIKGDLISAIQYVKQFPERSELYNRFTRVFEQEQYIIYKVDACLNRILTIYQQYYRDIFYLCIDKETAAAKLRARLAEFLDISDEYVALCDMEQKQIAEEFMIRGFQFLGGKTSGYYGPYIWQNTETKTYEVELPDGVQTYTIKLLDGFIAKSWIDYLSFGEIGPGGWSDGDGIINCVKSSYDFDSENFKVSLLKHEAQHAKDLAINRDMSPEDLEYRAKLVELIYSSERNLLEQFIQEADEADEANGHCAAAHRIVMGFSKQLGTDPAKLGCLPIARIQDIAKLLFNESSKELFA